MLDSIVSLLLEGIVKFHMTILKIPLKFYIQQFYNIPEPPIFLKMSVTIYMYCITYLDYETLFLAVQEPNIGS